MSGFAAIRDGASASAPNSPLVDNAQQLVRTAREAQASFGQLSWPERRALLEQAARRLLENRAEGLRIVEKELGKVHADALFTEALGPLETAKAWGRVIEGAPRGRVRLNPLAFPKKEAELLLVPRGVVGVIAPWNFPVAGLYRSVFPALLLGNSVVVKPSERSPESSAWFLNHLAAVFPPGVVQTLQGAGEAGAALLDAGIDACVFTGSSRVGAMVERRAFELGIACSAEMGGNDGAIVLEDAALPRTIAGLVHWALQNAGQACGSVEVVYADQRIAPELEAGLADACSRLRPPARLGGPGSLSPLAFEGQLRIVEEQVKDAVAQGARVLCGGRADGLYYEPTVLVGCHSGMRVVAEETFGPVIPVVRVDGAADAIRQINRGRYGLTASIWTQDFARARRLADALEVGTVTVNNHAFTGAIVDLPWSGRRDSGRGIASSAWALLTFARPKAYAVDRNSGPDPFWVPWDDDVIDLGETLADAQLGRFGGAYRLPLLLRRRLQTVKRFFGIS